MTKGGGTFNPQWGEPTQYNTKTCKETTLYKLLNKNKRNNLEDVWIPHSHVTTKKQ